jgi:hypothetical protein
MDHASGRQRAVDRGLWRVDRGQPGSSRSPSGRCRRATSGDPMAADMCRASNARPGGGLPEGARAQRRCPGSPCRRRSETTRSLGDASGMASGGNRVAGASHEEAVGEPRSRPAMPSARGASDTESPRDAFRKGRQRHPSPSEASGKGFRDNRVAPWCLPRGGPPPPRWPVMPSARSAGANPLPRNAFPKGRRRQPVAT